MTLGVWMYFWDSAGWTGGTPPPVPTPAPPPESRGGGGGNKHQRKANNKYQPLSEAYWMTRESYLRGPKPTPAPSTTHATQDSSTGTFTGTLQPLIDTQDGLPADAVSKLEAYLKSLDISNLQ